MSLKKIPGLLALAMIAVFVTVFAPAAYAVSFSSPGAGSNIEQQGLFYPQQRDMGFPASDMGSNMNSPTIGRGDMGSQPGYTSPSQSDMSGGMSSPGADNSYY